MNTNDPLIPQTALPRASRLVFLVMTALLLGLFVLHAFKGLGGYPRIFPDECTYSYDTRLRSFSEVLIPNYLYYAIYKVVVLFGDDFLDAVRVLNALIFVLAGPFIYLIARRVCGPAVSLAITSLSLLSPISIYTHCFMAEPPYFTFFWVFVWLTLRLRFLGPAWYGAALGASLAVLSFIKVHALFLLPALALFLLLRLPGGTAGKNLRSACFAILAAVLAFFALKMGIGYAFAGENGLSFLGRGYTEVVAQADGTFDLVEFIAGAAYNAFGHIQGLLLVFGVPLAVMPISILMNGGETAKDNDLRHMAALSLAALATLVTMTASFVSYIDYSYFSTSYTEINRLQARFYNFLYPAFLIVAGYAWTVYGKKDAATPKGIGWLAVPFIAISVFAVSTEMQSYKLEFLPDCPELASLFAFNPKDVDKEALVYLCILAMAPGAVWLLQGIRKGAAVFLFIFIPVYTATSLLNHQYPMIEIADAPLPFYDTAIRIRHFLGEERSNLTIVSDDSPTAAMFAFFLDDTDVKTRWNRSRTKYIDPSLINPDAKWILLYGYSDLPEGMSKYTFDFIADNGEKSDLNLRLIRVADFELSAAIAPGQKRIWPLVNVVATDADVTLEYAIQLPKAMHIALEFTGTPPPEGAAYEIDLPETGRSFRLDGSQSPGYGAEMRNDDPGNILRLRRAENSVAAPWPDKIVVEPLQTPQTASSEATRP